uniref:Uncharacterized protein n=1 Tax=Aegilops tauschii TaxID=37682 RepID=N1R2B6_AEGTA
MGVPILAFPMAAEQKLNTKFVVDVIHMGLRVWLTGDADKEGGGLVVCGDVQVLARELIFGEEGRHAAARASELFVSSRKAMEVGGSSCENLAKMVQEVCVMPMMRLYLPRVEARLRGITALWYCRKKGYLHTIPCNEQERDNES